MATYKKSAATKQSILDATVQIVPDVGYGNFNIKDFSERTGIPRSLVYYYFDNKSGIMSVLYRMRYFDLEVAAEEAFSGGEDPLVRLLFKYVLFRRFMVQDDLFREFILTYPIYASFGPQELFRTTEEYYHDSISAFRHYGLSVRGNTLSAHVLTIDALSRAMYQGIGNGTLPYSEKEGTMLLAEHTIMPTFCITKEQTEDIVNQAYALSARVNALHSSYQYSDYDIFSDVD